VKELSTRTDVSSGISRITRSQKSRPWSARIRVDWAEYLARPGENERARERAIAAPDDVGDLMLTVTRNRAEAMLSLNS